MKSIVFIGTKKSGSSREALKAAVKLGYHNILITFEQKQFEQQEEYSDVNIMKLCDFNGLETIKTIIKELKQDYEIAAIVSFVEGYCYTANRLGEEFGLNHFTCNAIEKMESKYLSRKAIRKTPYCPRFRVIYPDTDYTEEEMEGRFPAILKSPKSTGSKDVYLINNYKKFLRILKKLTSKFPDEQFLFEEYLDGPQLIAEVLVIDGEVHIIGIIEQEISFQNGHFIVTGYYLQTKSSDFYDGLQEAVTEIIQLHGLENGACHLEIRRVFEEWKLVEINPRISGGGMNQLIELGTGINLVEQTLRFILEKEIDLQPKFKKHVYIQYKTATEEEIVERITGKQKAKSSEGVLSVYIKPRKGKKLVLPSSMGDRYAYVIATGANRKEAEENAKKAIDFIEFHIKSEESE